MTDVASEQAIAKHRIPVIDRMMDVLFLLEKRTSGASIRDLVDSWGCRGRPSTASSTRCNSTMSSAGRATAIIGSGPRLLALAARTIGDTHDFDLATLSRAPSRSPGAGDRRGLQGLGARRRRHPRRRRRAGHPRICADRRPRAAPAAPRRGGEQDPARLHAQGRAGRIPRAPARPLHQPHACRPEASAGELAKIRRQGWAQDKGEYAPSIMPLPRRSRTATAR